MLNKQEIMNVAIGLASSDEDAQVVIPRAWAMYCLFCAAESSVSGVLPSPRVAVGKRYRSTGCGVWYWHWNLSEDVFCCI